jgi:hypothetical protein
MDKTGLINYLIDQRKFKAYLEIGMHEEHQNFAHIRCAYKRIVTSDNMNNGNNGLDFVRNKRKFDIVFIDGIHTEEQVIKDISNAFMSLAKGGVIVIHDCMPPDAWHQRAQEDYHAGENWNGTVWKAVLKVFNRTKYKCYLVDTDWGCGIIDTAKSQLPLQRPLPNSLEYDLHYKWLLEYKITVAGYLREQVKVFYHLACMGNWQEVLQEQLLQLKGKGFQQISMVILGSAENVEHVKNICKELQLDIQIVFQAPALDYFEKPALLAIENYAKENEGYVLYLHSKGVSNPADGTKAKWRKLMMQELVKNWEYCVSQLQHYDVVGVNWREMPPTSHFCGNFWYASTNYLRRLANFEQYYENPRYQIWDRIEYKRLGCEFWISSSKIPPRVLSLVCRNVDFCNDHFWVGR